MSDDSFAEMAKERGLHESLIKIALGYYEASRRGEFSTVDPTLEQVIGRSPRKMRDVLAATVAEQ